GGLDCGIFKIISPAVYGCDSVISPIVQLKNYGTTNLDSVKINYFVDANTPSTYTWIGSLATAASVNIILPSVNIPTAGAHTFTATTVNPNGVNDTLAANDSKTSSFNLVFAGSVLPFSQGFEATTFPPTGWTRYNPDNGTTWARNTSAHKTGVASAYMNNYNYSSTGQIDELITPAIDLTTDAAPNLTFQVAYRLYTNPASSSPQSDTLSVFISTDCGISWQRIYYKYGVPLTTITPSYSTSVFVPTATQWRQESISLLPYASCKTAYLKFRNTNEFENQLYLDDIYINGPAGISDPASLVGAIDLFPNPANDLLTVNYLLRQNSNVSIQIFNMEGKEIRSGISEGEKTSGNYSEVIDVKNYPAGIYFMYLTTGNEVQTRKFMVVH
ncbi:MAG TPA: T9SS type A sorting domain-containing protein, partial [Bacteroidia bacterium]|nr:T9SS type A sorting domain-containing protein [Bacteroidia bacterium]